MSPKEQKRLFHPFTQGDSSVTRKFGGTGLGLVISQKIVQAKGGTVQLTSVIPAKKQNFPLFYY
jgi:signal transduction histidine kinase